MHDDLKGYTPVQQGASDGVDTGHILGALRRGAPWIVVCVVFAAGAAYALSKRETKKYTATASLVFNNNQVNQQAAGLQPVNGNNQQAQQQTNVKLVQLGDMAAKVAARLGQGLTEKKVREDIGVSAQGESNIVDVAATATSPALAAAIANNYTEQFVAEQQKANHAYYASALALVSKQLAALSARQRLSPSGIALAGRAQSLGVLAELRNGNVEVAQTASLPTAPSSPKTTRNTFLGALLGLLLGVGLAFLLERLDRRIREPKDLERIYDLPLLGVIPESKALSRAARKAGSAASTLSQGEMESFHLIRAHLRYFNVDRDLRTLMVVSAAPGDGKTTIARHLSAAGAAIGSRVLLIEVDLRRPTVAQQLEIPSGPGLADVLIGSLQLRDAIRSIPLDVASGEGSEGRKFDVLVAGAIAPPNPAELVESNAMEAVLAQAKATYDLIVIDTPPLTAVSDAFPLLRKVDGVLVVGRVGRNRRDVAERLHETLKGVRAPLLGVIANGVKASGLDAYSYAYDYSPSERQASPGQVSPPASPNGAGAESEALERSAEIQA
jgi:tyrosine-protein kinase